ncbi:MAG: hypothetical protein CVT49_06190 [candidate division Zixibacteria bacterium HGW-Zixibacteria-1]|nr:MAG: hypothetical protein CVT49_06190 [candidate division Zixibacteria bacterium HGW-Zixibacteria-1]
MSGAPIIASSVGAIAAAERMREEEENMTSYDKNDINGWEFKIMRSNLGRFSSYETVKKICEQEAKAGWELVEKFDQYRLRFKRRIEMRAKDQYLDFDPYRTGISGGGGIAAMIIGLSLLALGALIFGIIYLKGQHIRIEPGGIIMIIVAVGIVVLLIGLIAMRIGRVGRR